MDFSFSEILRSVLMSLCFGVGYALAFSLLSCLLGVIKPGRAFFTRIIDFENIFPLPTFRDLKITPYRGAVFSFLSVLLFAITYSLLSYLALDGEIRLYTLFFYFASFYLSRIAFFGIFIKAFELIIRALMLLISLFVRILFRLVLRPLSRGYLPIKQYFDK